MNTTILEELNQWFKKTTGKDAFMTAAGIMTFKPNGDLEDSNQDLKKIMHDKGFDEEFKVFNDIMTALYNANEQLKLGKE